MGNCLKRCFGQVKTKRNKYFTGRYNNCDVNIEFENLIEDDEVERNHTVLTDEERDHLLNRRYTELVQEQQRVDARLDKELKLEEENARLEEEAYIAARREASRAARQARELEKQKQLNKPQKNGTKSWLGSDAGDWEIATEDDFETFLETVKAKSETVRATVASMLNNNPAHSTKPIITGLSDGPPTASPTASPTRSSNPVGKNPTAQNPSKHTVSSTPMAEKSGPAARGAKANPVSVAAGPVTSPATASLATTGQVPICPPQSSVQIQRDGWTVPDDKAKVDELDGDGQALDQTSGQPDVVSEANQVISVDESHSENGRSTEGSRGMSYYLQPKQGSNNGHPGDKSDVEWEAEFVSADSAPELISYPSSPLPSIPSSAKAKLTGSSDLTSVPLHPQPRTTGLPSHSRTNGSALANGRLPFKRKEAPPNSSTKAMMKTATAVPTGEGTSGTVIKPKKSLDIDIDKFLEELEFDI